MTEADLLRALLDTLLPGDGGDWPAAGSHGLAETMRDMSHLRGDGKEALETVLAKLPEGFAAQSAEDREDQLARIESAEPEAFGAVVVAAYNAYYTDPAVRDTIERLCGYENRPPQPLGYDLPPFDERLLAEVKARGPIWRPVPEE